MHNNNNYQCKMCWNKALTFGVGSIQLSFHTIVFTYVRNTCKGVSNPNVTTFQSNCAEGLYFSAFHLAGINFSNFSITYSIYSKMCDEFNISRYNF